MRQNKRVPRFPLRLPVPSLRIALVGAVLVPFLVATAATGWLGITFLERQTQERMREDIELIARAIRLPLSHALERGREGAVQQALESAFKINRVYGVYIYDQDGSMVARSGTRKASTESERASRIAEGGERQGEFERAGEEEVFSYFVPLVDSGGRVNGLLQVTRQGREFDRYIDRVRASGTGVFLTAGLVLALIVFLGHRWVVGRHLERMEGGLGRVEAGDLHHRLTPRGPRELRTLAAGLNQMLDAVLRSRGLLAEQREREAVLTERLHQAEKMAALGQLAAGVAHELGSPLSTVDGKALRALRRDDLPDPVRQSLGRIREETGRMERIIRQLVDFGRANPLYRTRLPADRPLRSALRQLQEGPGSGAVRVELDIRGPTPVIAVDTARLEQALSNLLRNAVQAAATQVRAGGAPADGGYQYWVEDDGPGFDEPTRSRLFEPFFTTKSVGEGSGLGLAIAHSAVVDHGGRIEAETSPLGGALFRITLPLDPEGPDESDG